jgi:8-oxo-dGTP pyrophosphatase MutT (NUDIX family)
MSNPGHFVQAEALAAKHPQDLVALYNMDERCVWASASHDTILGVSPAASVGRHWHEFVAPEDHDHARLAGNDAFLNGRSINFSIRARGKSGDLVALRCQAWLVRDEASGQPLMTFRATPENHLPFIHRRIGVTIIFSSDGQVLLGRKTAKGGGVYADRWHLPGGGAEPGESLADCALREVNEEVAGLKAVAGQLEALPWIINHGATTKKLPDGRQVWCEMEFNYFRYVSPESAAELMARLQPGSDFIELKFFTREDLARLDTVPNGVEAKIVAGELTPTSGPAPK